MKLSTRDIRALLLGLTIIIFIFAGWSLWAVTDYLFTQKRNYHQLNEHYAWLNENRSELSHLATVSISRDEPKKIVSRLARVLKLKGSFEGDTYVIRSSDPSKLFLWLEKAVAAGIELDELDLVRSEAKDVVTMRVRFYLK
ncbi:General secretion pathway, M protein [Marinobacterium sp. xm-g-59]|uniref:type II secretion system protein M n=1 Tax=Marinobacterium sp. xm-g-59 TaxID=2497748 RepID=UPI001569D2B6|nr:type II secretion system protein M [Marinobacterium sp. xm-g-59]NRP96113.1 General secretion pathway, M protein [Marinobacterium sp. xm-g-59]